MTGMNAPTTHASWNRVSNFANERPRFASGASRCTIESNASLPPLAPSPTTSAAAVADASLLPNVAAAMPVTMTSNSTAIRMVSSVQKEITTKVLKDLHLEPFDIHEYTIRLKSNCVQKS